MAPKGFICHASEDKERFVLPFATKLREKGLDIWLDKWEMFPGDSLVDKVFEEGIKNASTIIIVISKNSQAKPWVKEEINAAFVKRIEGKTKIIPVLIDDCEIPECLKSTFYSKINPEDNYEDELKRIVLSIFGQTDKPKIGKTPAYMEVRGLEIPELAEIDNKVLFKLCEIALEENGMRVFQPSLKTIADGLGMSGEDFQDTLKILENRSYIKGQSEIGNGIFMVSVPNETIEIYLKNTMGDIGEIFQKVGLCLINGNIKRNILISDSTGMPLNIVNFALDRMKLKKLIRTIGFLGGGIDVVAISPELKRLFR